MYLIFVKPRHLTKIRFSPIQTSMADDHGRRPMRGTDIGHSGEYERSQVWLVTLARPRAQGE